MKRKLYFSKKDPWLFSLVWGSVALPLVTALTLLIVWRDVRSGSYLLAVAVVTFLLTVSFSWPLSYEINDNELIIRSGFLRWRIPLAAIDEVRPTRNWISAPAWSLDRLLIRYSKGERLRLAMISPENRAAFMRSLAEMSPGLMIVGERLVRTGSGP